MHKPTQLSIFGKARSANTFLAIFYVSLFLTIFLGISLFDVKISSGGDDSDYILSAKKFMEGREFPSWHGSFYPIFLSLPYLIFGFHLDCF